MNELFERLARFFERYFHQEWAARGATSWQEVIEGFVRDEPQENIDSLSRDLKALLAITSDDRELRAILPMVLRSHYDPEPELSPKEWIEVIVSRLEREQGSRARAGRDHAASSGAVPPKYSTL